MHIDPNDLLLFARVAETGSFTRAAERLDLPKSSVSRRLAALERRLGEQLLLRTTRKLSLTDFGRHLLEHARQVASEVEAAQALALHRQAQPSGRLKVSMPGDLAGLDLERLLTRFLTRYPQVALELDVTPRRVDLIGENYDLAIRMGELEDDASLVARRLFDHEWGLYASPHYLALHGEPASPGDLHRHQGLTLRTRAGDAWPWRLTRGAEHWEGVAPARVIANSPPLLMRLAQQATGIVALPHTVVRLTCPSRAGERPSLVRVLPDWCLPRTQAWAVMPGRRLMPARTRAFLDMLQQAIDEAGLSEPADIAFERGGLAAATLRGTPPAELAPGTSIAAPPDERSMP